MCARLLPAATEETSRQLVRDLLVKNLAHGERDDDAVLLAEEARDLRHRVAGVGEAHEEPLLAFRAANGGLEGVHVRPPGLVLLLHLDGEPAFLQREFVRARLAHVVHRGDGEDAPVYPHVAHLRLVLAPAEGDDGTVLKLEGRQLA